MTYNCYLCCRDAQTDMGTVLLSILEQRLPPESVFVYDDGSTDHTVEVIEDLQETHSNLYLLKGSQAPRDISRLPANFNRLFLYAEQLGKRAVKYDLITADDVILYPDYAEKLTGFLDSNPDYGIVSGVGTNDKWMKAPRGIRFIRTELYAKSTLFNAGLWAENPSFESALVYEGLRQGYKTKAFNDIKFIHLRDTGKDHNYRTFGRAMKALNYSKLYVLARLVSNLITGYDYPRIKTWNILSAYLRYKTKETYPPDFISFIHKVQHDEIVQTIMRRIAR